MTDEAKALVERLRLKSRDTRETSPATCDDAANLIETQAREIERLREALALKDQYFTGIAKLAALGEQ